MEVVTKDATITNTSEKGPGEFHVILSAQTLDRDGDVLKSEDWETPLPDHITFDQDHGMSVKDTIGSGVPFINPETGNLEVKGTYSSLPRAQDVRTLVKEGHINRTSVAFMTKKVAKANGEGTRTVRELLNGAFVAIPSNREAVILSSKGVVADYKPTPYRADADETVKCPKCERMNDTDAHFCDQCGFKLEGASVDVAKGYKSGARNSAKDAEKIQGIHDHAASLGADCTGASKSYHGDRTKKSIVGSLEATQDRIRDALQDANPGVWVYLRGTVPDGNGGGYVVFGIEDPDTYDCDTFKQSYRDDGSVVTLMGDAEPVDVMETVTSDPDEDATDSGASAVPASAAGKSAAVAATEGAPVAGASSDEAEARSLKELADLLAQAADIRLP